MAGAPAMGTCRTGTLVVTSTARRSDSVWLVGHSVAVMASSGFARLSRKHGIKIGAVSLCSVEEVALAVGEIIGHSCVKSTARMNRAVVLFLDKVEQPATRVTLSNVPPFISDDFLIKELSRHGKVVSPIKKVLSGCKSHRRQLFMILNNKTEEFNYRFMVRVDDFDYALFATTSFMKCFGCGEEGHAAVTAADHGRPIAAVWRPVAAVRRSDASARPVAAVRLQTGTAARDGAIETSGSEGAAGAQLDGDNIEVSGERESGTGGSSEVVVEMTDLEIDIVELETLSDSRGNRGYIEVLKSKKLALAKLLDTKVQGALVRSRVQNITEMDAPSSFFFGLEKKHGRKKEPLVYGTRLDVCSGATPRLMTALCRTGTLVLEQLIDIAGPALMDSRAVGSILGIQSARIADRILDLWRQRLSGKEKSLLMDYTQGNAKPNHRDPFPEVHMNPQLEELSGPLLKKNSACTQLTEKLSTTPA
ncbi:hypothetical protein JOB18_010430 [Solea senegalensis]|uniref:Uncharacterized protein n=1 Tax=Solea senegalensis TaxID=28829 RepID=A0AAV6PYY4_SOLSE|nr:hypothetical protein JOB18_010430 [Solea senegalensis]